MASGGTVAKAVGALLDDVKNGGNITKAVMGIAFAAVILFTALLYYMSPMSLLQGISIGSGGAYTQDDNGNYRVGINDESLSIQVIDHYVKEAESLEVWARSRWSSGSNDIYVLPDWRWLWALDATLADNDYTKILKDPSYYQKYHQSLLFGIKRTSTYVVEETVYTLSDGSPITKETEGALLDEETGVYYLSVTTEVTIDYWEVKHKSFKEIFTSLSANITDELFYYMHFESGAFGSGWGDLGNALGAFQFDRRYALPSFIDHCYNTNPEHYYMFAPYIGISPLPQGDLGLEAAWIAAYNNNPEEFTSLQYQWEIEHYCMPAWNIMSEFGVDMSGRRDAIKGLVAGLCNAMGQGGLKHGISKLNLSNDMSDLELAQRICAAVYNSSDLGSDWLNAGKNVYLSAFQNRYRNELAIIEELLSLPPVDTSTVSGEDFSTLQLELSANYLKAVKYVSVENGQVIFDQDGFTKYMTGVTVVYTGDISVAQQRVVAAALSGDMYGKGEGMCEGWAEEVYRHAGYNVPKTSCAREAGWAYAVSDDMDNIPIGATVFAGDGYRSGYACGGHDAGHVGVYIGEGVIVSNEIGAPVVHRSVESWIQIYSGGYWGWMGGIDLSQEP